MTEHIIDEAIAIVGMGCRLPGADDLDQFWNLIHSASSAVGPLPPDRLNRELYFHPQRGQLAKTYTDLGGIVQSRPFDRERCPLRDEVIEQVDVAHLTLLEVAAEAVRNGGYDPYQLPFRNVGVFVGHTGGSPLVSNYLYGTVVEEGAAALTRTSRLAATGLDPAAIRQQVVREVRRAQPRRNSEQKLRLGALVGSELISEAFELNGPYLVVDAACASSLQAMALGIRSLLQGKLDAALVGGASYCKADSLVLFSAAQSVSPTGTCPFSREADGLVSAEGYVVFLLKTLARAVRDGDRIHAVISGLGVSSDGRGKSLWAPRAEGQILAVQRAYGSLDADRLQYIEAHATSTQVGDATELQALSEALRKMFKDPHKRIPIGSVKGNVGHTLETAGVAGLLKTVLSIQKQTIPPAVACRELNSEVDWSACPFYVPFAPERWLEFADGHPRRAAVNSFGIGGLNVHVVVDEYQPESAKRRLATRSMSGSSLAEQASSNGQSQATGADDGAIAIIGMGCIFPGAHTLEAFWDLLKQGRDPKIEAPPNRIPPEGYDPGEPQSWRTFSRLGGFVEGWQYDWRRHKIPPKQIAQANPLQFMLLDAADQAFQHAGLDPKSLSGARTSVIVGTIFGGDFSDHLQMGLRLPEFRAVLRGVLQKERVPQDQILAIEEEFQEKLLQMMPALLDETGSFTSSTLASRITKSFNLMGGALALDAGDCSAAMVIQSAMDQLRVGHVDMVVCAAGQRSMDLWCYEGLSLAGCLARTPRSGLDSREGGFVPGEGCGVVILKRLQDARRDGNPIHGVLRGIAAWSDSDRRVAVEKAAVAALADAGIPSSAVMAVDSCATRSENLESKELQGLVAAFASADRDTPLSIGDLSSQIGHTGGGAGMAALVKCTLAGSQGEFPPTLHLEEPEGLLTAGPQVTAPTQLTPLPTVAGTGYRAAAISSVYGRMSVQIVVDNGVPKPPFEGRPQSGSGREATAPVVQKSPPTRVAWFAAESGAALQKRLQSAVADASDPFQAPPTASFKQPARCAILANSAQDLSKKLSLAADLVSKGRHDQAADQGIFFATETTPAPKVALLFPGQGSQYLGMFRPLCEQHVPLRSDLERANEAMRRFGFSTFDQLAWDPASPLGKDIWTTQIAMLLADWLAWRSTQHVGVRPDVVAGHSFGEFPALIAAGAWTLEEAILATRARCDAVLQCASGDSLMLSVVAGRQAVESMLLENGRHVWFCAENGPEQCVVGGATSEVQAFAARCATQKIRSTPLPVPCAFHTPLMKPAQPLLEQALAARQLTSTRLPFVSTTFPCFLSRPIDLRASLVAQMTHPVEFAETIRRLVQAGANTFIEVGPSQVLSTLTRRILATGEPVRILPLDSQKTGHHAIDRLTASCWAWGIDLQPIKAASVPSVKSSTGSIRTVDATERRRKRMRDQAGRYRSAAADAKSDPLPADLIQSRAAVAPAAKHGSPQRNTSAVSARTDTPADGNGAVRTEAAARQPPQPQQQAQPAGWDERTAQIVIDVLRAHGLTTGTQWGPDDVWTAQVNNRSECLEDLCERFDLAESDCQELTRATTIGGLVRILQTCPGKSEWVGNGPKRKTLQPENLQRFLVNFVVEQTGYPPEIVELDADLEADLGIDSIKKAQLFGELGQQFQLSADPNLSLDDFPTLRHVLDYLHEHTGGHSQENSKSAMPEQSAHTERPARVDLASEIAPSRNGAAAALLEMPALEPEVPQTSTDLEEFLVNFVVEQTGYPPEIVELDADLEADLGIDSIKKAQLFGEIGHHFRVSADPNLSLDDFTTLRHVMLYLQAKQHGPTDAPTRGREEATPLPIRAAASVVIAPADVPKTPVAERPVSLAAQPPARPAVATPELHEFLVNFVVEQTGYPPEIVELDADLEADLGIDSIKKAQLFGELGNHFQLAADPNLSLDDFPTLRHVLDYLAAHLDSSSSATAASHGDVAASAEPAASATANADYDRGFVHGREYRDTIRAALRRAAATPDKQGSLPAQWFDRLAQPERDELLGIADGAEVLPANLIAWQTMLGTARHPLVARIQFVDERGQGGAAVSGLARVESALCLEQSTQSMTLRIAGQLGAIAGVNRHGVLVAYTGDNGRGAPDAIPAAILVARALASATQAQHAVGLDDASEVDMIATQWGNQQVVRGGHAANGDEAEEVLAGTLAQIQQKLDESAATDWLNGRTAVLGGLPTRRAYHLLFSGAAAWMRLHDDGMAENGAAQWQRLDLPFALPAPAKAAPARRLTEALPPVIAPQSPITQRFIPRVVPAGPQALTPQRQWPSSVILFGDAGYADTLASDLAARGIEVRRLSQRLSPTDLEEHLTALLGELPQSSLILALDQPADLPRDQAAWDRESQVLLLNPFRVCQLWIGKSAADAPARTLMAAISLGGHFGLELDSISPWAGGLSGLLKGLRNEFPKVVVRIVDVAADVDSRQAGSMLAKEFLGVEHETETGLQTTGRKCIRYEAAEVPKASGAVPQPGDQWVITGGARGVTGYVAKALGERYGLNLHLIGTTALPDRRYLEASEEELRTIRTEVMLAARKDGRDPLRTWSSIEKGIEIHRQLAEMKAAGVDATYHVCDLSDWELLARVLARIRQSGPIRGVVHGAGFEAAARFEKKKLDSVRRTLNAKAGGAAVLAAATMDDPIEWFIAFGSTSGRLGGFGQADYSLANDMLAKEMDWLRSRRPACRATTFHWHAWDEVGMAARPESRFALESFGLSFMPPREGVAHLLRELEAGLPEPEVMITEDKLCPPALHVTSAVPPAAMATVAAVRAATNHGAESRSTATAGPSIELKKTPLFTSFSQLPNGSYVASATLDPTSDVFLTDHRMIGRPVLPGVTGCEMLAQAAAASTRRGRYTRLQNVEVLAGLRFPTDDLRRVEVEVTRGVDGNRGVVNSVPVERETGRQSSRKEHVAGEVLFPDELTLELPKLVKPPFPYNPMVYPEDAAMYHGLALRTLNGLMFQQSGGWGRLRSPGTASLAGTRTAEGWILPMALLDGCIVGCAVFSWLMCGLRVEIPDGFADLWILKEPAREETCQMQFRFLRSDESNSWYDFDLFGHDGQPIVLCRGLRLVKFGKDELA